MSPIRSVALALYFGQVKSGSTFSLVLNCLYSCSAHGLLTVCSYLWFDLHEIR
jgi:hypothetical protein